jgi:unsaturated rhamnogalacturonyl hydrolase
MYGLFTAGRKLNDDAVVDYVKEWLNHHLINGIPTTFYCGSWGPGLLYPEIAATFPRPETERYAEMLFDHIRLKALRDGRGIILHNLDLPHVFVDTVYYSSPIIAKLGVYLKREWVNDAALQLFAHASVLQDPHSFLFIHAEENLSGIRSEGYWARGNGWIAMTCAELMSLLPKSYEHHRKIRAFFRQIAAAIVNKQSASGMWRTIMEDAKAYEETSATAMFCFALKRGRSLGILDPAYDKSIAKARRALAGAVDKNGIVTGASAGTLPNKAGVYKALPTGEYTWGPGAWLLAGCEFA